MKNKQLLQLFSIHVLRVAFLFFAYKAIVGLFQVFRCPADVALLYTIAMSVSFAVGSLLMAGGRKVGLLCIYGTSALAVVLLLTTVPETISFHPLQMIIGLLVIKVLFYLLGYFRFLNMSYE